MKPKMILLAGAIALALASPLAHSKTTRVDFSKCPIANPADSPPGTLVTNRGPATAGGVAGVVTAFVLPGSFVPLAPNVLFLSAKYVVVAGPNSFVAHVTGRYDLNIGEAELDGVVSEGWNTGSRVVDTFHSIAGGCVAGRLAIKPWPLDDNED